MSNTTMGGKHSKEKYGLKQNQDGPKVNKNNKCKKPLSPIVLRKDSKKQNAPENLNKPTIISGKVEKSHCISRHPELFDTEKDSDVTFLVGVEPEIWRLPAHKFILVPASPVFSAMLKGPMSKDCKEEVPINDIEPIAFENVLRFVYTSGLKMTSVEISLETLYAAEKYMISELVHLCLQHLDVNLSTGNVLVIYPAIRHYANVRNTTRENNHDAQSEENPYIPLLNRCLERIDNYAEQVLMSEDFEGLSDIEIISEIVFRDSLQVNSELTVFSALQHWATRQCKCKQKEMTAENKRTVLGSSLYAVRYLLMRKDEFLSGPFVSDLLTTEERIWILSKITGHVESEPPHHLADRIRYMERRRGYPNLMMSKGLGSTSPTSTSILDSEIYQKKKKCCKVSKVFTECFLCFSLFFD